MEVGKKNVRFSTENWPHLGNMKDRAIHQQ